MSNFTFFTLIAAGPFAEVGAPTSINNITPVDEYLMPRTFCEFGSTVLVRCCRDVACKTRFADRVV